ncbi:cytochrome c oxidase subunit 5b-2, mitochondrial-like [Cornus florida]|uniref:cytochrome c oxidase subunit 5b-2, mitochondrial-like n=1 Tax=Cornus florida TaxID=4283 RepID=UPI002897BCBD|nr:cytochrome c oxidase subunit 5b-2, mitochondrial-like [Cornus florida]
MWRRVVPTQVQTLAPWRRLAPGITRSVPISGDTTTTRSLTSASSSPHTTPFHPTFTFSSHQAATDSDTFLSKGKKRVEDVMPIATGHEREELEAELEGRNILEMNYPVGPFGTKERPAIVKSVYNKRIVGCPGGEGEEEHDVVWFWLEKGKPHECPVCSQHFKLQVVGSGGPPDGHGDDDHH